MIVPLILFLLSCALAGYLFLRSGAVLTDLMLLALISALASLILLFLAPPAKRDKGRAGPSKPEKWIVVDGSNVMHWKDEVPRLATVLDVVQALTARGYSPGVVFDANVGYKTIGRYLHNGELAKQLGLPEDRVLVVPKGTQADPYLLITARDLGARVVTNDRFRDWVEAHPEVCEPGLLIRGGYHEGKLWLEDAVPAEDAVAL